MHDLTSKVCLRIFQSLICITAFLLFSGCASIVNGRHQDISIKSTPPATVMMGDKEIGKTPVSIAVKRKYPPVFNLSAPGYKTYEIRMKKRLSGWMLLDPILPMPIYGVVGIPIDLINGAAFKLIPKEIDVTLIREGSVRSRESKHKIEKTIELPYRTFPRRNIAVAPLEALGLSQTETLTLTESLRSKLVRSDYFNVVTRSDMKKILEEQNFQRSSCSDKQCLIEMGKILAVEKIVGGTIGRVGDTFSVSVRMVDVETGRIEQTATENVTGREDRLLETLSSLGNKLALEYAESK